MDRRERNRHLRVGRLFADPFVQVRRDSRTVRVRKRDTLFHAGPLKNLRHRIEIRGVVERPPGGIEKRLANRRHESVGHQVHVGVDDAAHGERFTH